MQLGSGIAGQRFPLKFCEPLRFPPLKDPVQISYEGGHLFVGSMGIICQWNTTSQAFIQDIVSPSMIDLLALSKTVPRSEISGTGLGRKIRSAHEKAERRILNAAKQLEDLEVTEAEIRSLVDVRMQLDCTGINRRYRSYPPFKQGMGRYQIGVSNYCAHPTTWIFTLRNLTLSK